MFFLSENTPNGTLPEFLNIISSEITQNVEQDEVSTRKFHQTMCLRAPKRKSKYCVCSKTSWNRHIHASSSASPCTASLCNMMQRTN